MNSVRIALLCALALPAAAQMIDTSLCALELAPGSGDLIGARWKSPAIELIAEPRLGENFRLLLPRPGFEANYFLSREQKARVEPQPDGVAIFYRGLRNAGGALDVDVTYRIRAAGGQLEFSIEVDNRTALPLAEVYFGIVGGQQGLGKRHDNETLVPGTNVNLAPALFTRFQAGGFGGGNLGIRYSANGYFYPGTMPMSWMGIYNRKEDLALYYADHDVETRQSALYFELHPFDKTAVIGDNWPAAADVPAGEPIGLKMGWIKFPYTRKGVFRAGPLALQLHRGGWQESTRIYRAWFDRHFTVKRPATWLRREMAWQSIILSNCEDVVVHRFRDLPRLAADALKYGVTTFEILGWDVGGIDRGYPQYTPDPRLGTAAEFRDALAEIRKLGVHPLIFANIQVADTATPLFRERLHNYTVNGRWADDLRIAGWGEGTIGARMGLARSNVTAISPSHPEVRKLLLDQFTDLARAGAQGFQLDKTNMVGMLDFNPRLAVSPDRSLSQGLLDMFRDTLARCRKIDPAFALASELWWDRSFPVVDVSYQRMNAIDMSSPVLRYAFPEWTATIFAETPGDFNVMNNGMRYGLVWALAPRHYNDSLDEPLTRPLARYVQAHRIRKRHESVLFHGRFRNTDGAEVKGGQNVRYSVFEDFEGAGKAVVAVSFGNEPADATVSWPGGAGVPVVVEIPFEPARRTALPATLRLPPHTCAVVAR